MSLSYFLSRRISLSLTANYARSWGTWEGIRELTQNWHDGLYDGKKQVENKSSKLFSDITFKKHEDNFAYELHEAAVTEANECTHCLGYLLLDKVDGKLYLINRLTSLQKRILLLGYSQKSETASVIGQFGEGLKIGALALLREGRLITMETSEDVWRFDLCHDENFGEKVLTVFVTDRENFKIGGDQRFEDIPVSLEKEDTITAVTLNAEEWKQLKHRFLFLQPPEEEVKSEIGSLLLDTRYQGQLYVKGVWVSDLSTEDLATGVNFVNLRIDRDRNAVPKPSEIDHMVSCMWIKAITSRPELAQTYLKLLQNDKYRDVRQALEYASFEALSLIADEFFNTYGDNVFAVDSSSTQQELDQIQRALNKEVVICNETLVKLLRKSGRLKSLEDELLDRKPKKTTIIPLQLIGNEEMSVLEHSVELLKLGYPDFSLAVIDVIDVSSPESEGCVRNGDRLQVPLWMLREQGVSHIPLCNAQQMSKFQCKCRESRIVCSLSVLLDADLHATMGDIFSTIPPCCHHRLLKIIAPLASQLCNKSKEGYCQNLHSRHHMPEAVSHTLCVEREKKLQEGIGNLQENLQTVLEDHQKNLQGLRSRLEKADKELVQREIDCMNQDAVLESKMTSRLDAAQKAFNEKLEKLKREQAFKETEMLSLKNELQYLRDRVEYYQKHLEGAQKAMDRQHEAFLEEMMYYVNQCKSRTKTVNKLIAEQLEVDDLGQEAKDKLQLLQTLSTILTEDLQKDKILCTVCMARRKEVLLVPCSHYTLCLACSQQVLATDRQCPLCKTHVQSSMKVYG